MNRLWLLGAVMCIVLQLPGSVQAGGVQVHSSFYECARQAVRQQEDLTKLAAMAAESKGQITKMYLHWSAMPYEMAFDDYHINIGRFGEIRFTCQALTERKGHIWRRNSGAVGISMDCMLNGAYQDEKTNWGPCPPTNAQLRTMAKVVAVLARGLELEISKESVMTHAEAAILDDYGIGSGDPETRWDLLFLIDPVSYEERPGGDLIRRMALKETDI